MLIPNPHAVPVKQWRRWSHVGKQVFNAVYEEMTGAPNLFLHPEAVQVSNAEHKRLWTTTAWNAAWIAADAATKAVTE